MAPAGSTRLAALILAVTLTACGGGVGSCPTLGLEATTTVARDGEAAAPSGTAGDMAVEIAGVATTVAPTADVSGADEDDAGSFDAGPAADSEAVADTVFVPLPEGSVRLGETNVVAKAVASDVQIYDEPGVVSTRFASLSNPTDTGGPLVFLAVSSDATAAFGAEWLEVHLPVRPNGSTGWVRGGDVELSQHDYKVVVGRSEHYLWVYDGVELIVHGPVAIGTCDTPTPGGVFYLKELLRPASPTGPYGSYAYGLSGFSNVLDRFNGGDGVIGIHGTNDPSSIGRDVSHGCIRVTNDVIEQLATRLPLGTPVEIIA